MQRRHRIGSVVLVLVVLGIGIGLAAWKRAMIRGSEAAAASQPEMPEVVSAVVVATRDHQPTTTAIGTVVALRSIVLRNELAGTVRSVALRSGEIVEAGSLLVQLDTAVEEAELAAQKAEAQLAESRLKRAQQLIADNAVAVEQFDQAAAQAQMTHAQIERTRAVIARKTLRAPFRARVGIADVHPGQYLDQGTQLTTLQGVDEAVHVDFVVAQQVAAGLKVGEPVEIVAGRPLSARIIAIDSRVNPQTRNATIRARIDEAEALAPGASVRVRIAAATPQTAIVVPSSALRRSSEGDHVFVMARDDTGATRARLRRVQVASVLGDEVLIGSGLDAGERVATAGSFKLRDNALVALAGGDGAAPHAAQ